MFEVTFTEVFLLVWAVLATAKWLHYKDHFYKTVFMLREVVENPEAREQILASYERFKKALVKN